MTPGREQADAVTAVLREAGELGPEDRIEGLRQMTGGWSRHSYTAQAALASGAQRRYVVRVRPPGALLDTDLALEYRVYAALQEVDVPTPRVFALVQDERTPFGGPFLVMQHIEGEAPNNYDRGDHVRLAEDWNGPRRIAADMVENLARIHGLQDDRLGGVVPERDFPAVVAQWQAVYEDKHLVRDPVIEEAFDWIAHRVPAEPWTGLVHGDYRIGNTLIAGGRVRAVLDWELVHVGDVRFDLGYLVMPRAAGKHLRTRTPLMGTFADQQWFMDRYGELTGRRVDADTLRTFEMLATMMILATQLTACWMYVHGHTTDVRMAWSRFSFAGLRQDMVRMMQW